jgi:NACHT domain
MTPEQRRWSLVGRRGRARLEAKDHLTGPGRWHSRPRMMALELGIGLGALLFLALIVWSMAVVVHGEPLFVDLDDVCDDSEMQCGVLFGFGSSLLTVALASALFVIWRLRRVTRPIRHKAKTSARDYVPTAVNSIMDQVVGRDELCNVIMLGLKDREARRPHLLIGGVGAGKTAVMVHLTELAARRGLIPVPILLREVGDADLDFSELARQRFCRVVDEEMLKKALVARAIGDQAWRWLRKEDRVLVLADGLEEAFAEGEKEKDRDNLIRRAIREADQQGLPLVVASRPHAPLRDVEAAITELEPLSEEAALAYIEPSRHSEDEHRLDWVVERADVTEAPLYLQVTRQLHRYHQLKYVVGGRGDHHKLDTRNVDRAGLRGRLLKTWTEALISGDLRPELALPREERAATVEQISALACVGLQRDTLEVKFEHLQGPEGDGSRGPYPNLWKELVRRVGKAGLRGPSRVDLPLAATWGEQLRLVEAHGDRVRFQHSIMQAYLGSRFLDIALQDPNFLARALAGTDHLPSRNASLFARALASTERVRSSKADGLRQPGPGREFLMSLVFRSRGEDTASTERGADTCVDQLVKHAEQRRDVKAVDLYATALELDSGRGGSHHQRIAQSLREYWGSIYSQDQQGLVEAKLNLVHRFGEVLRMPGQDQAAYREFFEIGCAEPSYAVRLAIAEEIGAGGDTAFVALDTKLDRAWKESTPNVTATRNETEWGRIMGAWLTPMLVGSVSDDQRGVAKDRLVEWLNCVRPDTRAYRESRLGLLPEVALSQGFKAAANRRERHFATCAEARVILVEQAEDMLKCARFWFSQQNLIQALTLWALPDRSRDETPASASARWQGISPHKQVDHWLSIAGRDAERSRLDASVRAAHGYSHLHPFVREAGALAVRALETGHPERYLWIDETGVVNKVGSRPTDPTQPRIHNLWIPPSTGWTALDRRAQQLVADVLLLLNLSERGAPEDHERYLERANRNDLPPCLTGDRSPMRPDLSIARPGMSDPGSSCADGCPFELCPYPPRGTAQRHELGEAFCRRQQSLARRWEPGHWIGRGPAPWRRAGLPRSRRARVRDLRAFWRTMADRRRVPAPDTTGP